MDQDEIFIEEIPGSPTPGFDDFVRGYIYLKHSATPSTNINPRLKLGEHIGIWQEGTTSPYSGTAQVIGVENRDNDIVKYTLSKTIPLVSDDNVLDDNKGPDLKNNDGASVNLYCGLFIYDEHFRSDDFCIIPLMVECAYDGIEDHVYDDQDATNPEGVLTLVNTNWRYRDIGRKRNEISGDPIVTDPDQVQTIDSVDHFKNTRGYAFEYARDLLGNTFQINIPTAGLVAANYAFSGTELNPLLSDRRYLGTVEFPGFGDTTDSLSASTNDYRAYAPDTNVFSSNPYDTIYARCGLSDNHSKPIVNIIESIAVTFSNSLSPLKAIGVLGAVSQNYGQFALSASLVAPLEFSAYQDSALQGKDAFLDFMIQNDQGTVVFDVPRMELAAVSRQPVREQAIRISMQTSGFGDREYTGHTINVTVFPYLPVLREQEIK